MTIPIPSDEALLGEYHTATPRGNGLHAPYTDGLRAVATLAANQAAEQAVKEAVLRIDHWAQAECGYYEDQGGRAMLRRDFPSAFTPEISGNVFKHTNDGHGIDVAAARAHKMTDEERDAQRQSFARGNAAVDADGRRTGKPSPDPAPVRLDEATVRACIKKLHERDYPECGTLGVAIETLKTMLPKPTPAPEPERYVTLKEVEEILDGYGNGTRMVTGPVRNSIMVYLREWAAKRGPMLTPEQAEEAARKCLGWMESPDPTLLAALRLAAKQGGEA